MFVQHWEKERERVREKDNIWIFEFFFLQMKLIYFLILKHQEMPSIDLFYQMKFIYAEDTVCGCVRGRQVNYENTLIMIMGCVNISGLTQ